MDNGTASPSPRKAWIETTEMSLSSFGRRSPSPRKAWIETSAPAPADPRLRVAFPPEGVD